MTRIGVLTSGGDAPGMNAAIRSIVRTSLYHRLQVFGILHGFTGLIHDDLLELNSRSVADIIQRGGTILRTARSDEFRTETGQQRALEVLKRRGLEGLIVIGGDGSFRGAKVLADHGVGVIGIPGTIDNDIPCTDFSLGFDTAVNTVVDAINKIRDTATSHERVYVVEVMGRNTGHIALQAGLAGGAESILVPEMPADLDELCRKIEVGYKKGKAHSIIVVAEGFGGEPRPGRDFEVSAGFRVGRYIENRTGFETRITVLGHIQRGGAPTVLDRTLASLMGARAVQLLAAGACNIMTGYQGARLVDVPFDEVFSSRKEFNRELYDLANILSLA
ncbi:MAG: 6-phosphofructokinase [Bacillota bacterium]|nr:6-phosphofructokinase [Bacillota bacterium]